MRIEIGDAVDAIERGLGALGELLQLIGWQVAVLGLDLSRSSKINGLILPIAWRITRLIIAVMVRPASDNLS